MDFLALSLARRYTDESIEGIQGVLKGKNCTIKSIVPVDGGNKITFEWTADSGDLRTSELTVMDGETGVSVENIEINNEGHLICTLSDDSVIDAGYIGGTGVTDVTESDSAAADGTIKVVSGANEKNVKVKGLEFQTEENMQLEIDALFSGFDLPPLDPDDDDGIANQSDIDDIFSEDVPPEPSDSQRQGSIVTLSSSEIDSIFD